MAKFILNFAMLAVLSKILQKRFPNLFILKESDFFGNFNNICSTYEERKLTWPKLVID